ncbi:Uncharacterised protein [Mycobacteroides abscessus subsp. abscessus]|nr:Uncharacterised protein [Mycobacteroides abscessus subsp. abscessus]
MPSVTAALSAGSPASSPAITMTSSGPTHTGARVAVTKGRLTVSDSAPARIAPAVAAVPRPETHTTARERSSERNGSRAPSAIAVPTARTCDPAMDAACNDPSRSAAKSASASSRSMVAFIRWQPLSDQPNPRCARPRRPHLHRCEPRH